jgi:hypothetical protein
VYSWDVNEDKYAQRVPDRLLLTVWIFSVTIW